MYLPPYVKHTVNIREHTLSKLRVDKMKHYIQSSFVPIQNHTKYSARGRNKIGNNAPLVGRYNIICCTLCVDDDNARGCGCKWLDRVVDIICGRIRRWNRCEAPLIISPRDTKEIYYICIRNDEVFAW